MRSLDVSRSRPIQWLFKLRGLPLSALTLEGLRKIGFAVLGEIPNQELLLGIVGRFWTLKGGLQVIDAEGFKSFNKEGYAKAVCGFHLRSRTETISQIVTETRIHCLDEQSFRRFRVYWIFIGPFSAWIRREALRIIKKEAERKNSLQASTVPG